MFLLIIMEGLASDVGITMVMQVVKLTLAVNALFSVKLMIATITKFGACYSKPRAAGWVTSSNLMLRSPILYQVEVIMPLINCISFSIFYQQIVNSLHTSVNKKQNSTNCILCHPSALPPIHPPQS